MKGAKSVANPSRIAAFAVLAAAAAVGVACRGGGGNGGGNGQNGKKTDAPDGKKVTLFGLAEVRGQIEPCGCTTDPLGDLARTASLVAEARQAGPVVVLDAGSLLYSRSPVPEFLEAQEQLKSDLLVAAYRDELQVAAIGLGPMDLAKGVGMVRPPRMAANVAADSGVPLVPPQVIDAGGARVGVFAVVSEEMAPGLKISDPRSAAKAAVAKLEAEQPEVVVALLTMSQKDAVGLLREVDGIDLAILGMGLRTPEPADVRDRAENIDGAWLVVPGNRGQVVSRLELTLRPGPRGLTDAVGEAAARAEIVALEQQIGVLERELAAFQADPSADPAFVARKQQEVADARAQKEALAANPLRAPAQGSYFTLDQVRIKKQIACDPELQAAKRAYHQAAGEANVKAAGGAGPLPPKKGQAAYVGVEACSDCHEEAVAFWEKTKHAGAWETLEATSQQLDLECTSCHVTGWDQPGGSTVGQHADLVDVQCETCHGPGSLHIEAESEAVARKTIQREPPADLCKGACHTKEHSDTFEYEPYLRDIVGPGHGEARRQALGDGPTGRELRAAGLERAGRTLGAGCVK